MKLLYVDNNFTVIKDTNDNKTHQPKKTAHIIYSFLYASYEAGYVTGVLMKIYIYILSLVSIKHITV